LRHPKFESIILNDKFQKFYSMIPASTIHPAVTGQLAVFFCYGSMDRTHPLSSNSVGHQCKRALQCW
jgi:hypothetical protein